MHYYNRASDRMPKKIKDYAEYFGHIYVETCVDYVEMTLNYAEISTSYKTNN